MHTLDEIVQAVIEDLTQGDLMQSCVQASTILAEVLKRTGFPEAFPLTVSVTAVNTPMAKRLYERSDSSVLPDEGAFENGEYAAVIDMDDPVEGRQWPGHLVVIVPNYFRERHAMIDVTIGQLNAPDKGVVLEPLTVPVEEAFVKGSARHTEFVGSNALFYQSHPADTTWQDSDGSMRRAGLMVMIACIAARLRQV